MASPVTPAAAAATTAAPAAAPAAATTSVASATPSATPSAAPAAPAVPATDSSPAAVATGTGGVPEAKPPADGESDADYFARALRGEVEAPKSEEPPADTGERIVADDDPAATQGETPATPETPEDDFDLSPYAEGLGAIGPKDLSTKLSEMPELSALLDQNPELKDQIFESTRLAAEASAYKEVFTSPEEARTAQQASAEFTALSDLVTTIEKPEDAQGFYGKLLELSVLRDDDGNILLGPDGKPRSDNTVGRLIHHTFALALNHWAGMAENDPDLAAAVDVLRQRAFGQPGAADREGLSEEQQQRAAQLDERENAVRTQEQQQRTVARDAYENGITDAIDTYADTAIGKLLAHTSLSEQQRTDIAEKIRSGVFTLISSNPAFRTEQDALMSRQGMGPKAKDARVGLGRTWIERLLPKVAPKLIAEAGGHILRRQGEQRKTQAAREAATRSDVAGSLRASAPLQLNAQQVNEQVTTSLRTTLGRQPRPDEVFAEVIRRGAAK